MKYALNDLILFSILWMLSGCSLMNRTDTAVFQIGLHEFTTENVLKSGMGIYAYDVMGSESHIVKKFAFLDSRHIMSGKLLPSSDGSRKYGLALTPTVMYRLDMQRLSWEFPGRSYAVLVDGFYVGKSSFSKKVGEDGVIEVAPLWDKYNAEKIVENIAKNYELYNR